MTAADPFRESIARLAADWTALADLSVRESFGINLDPRHCAAALRNRLSGVPAVDLAQAWDMGHQDACEDAIDGRCGPEHLSRNPYRA